MKIEKPQPRQIMPPEAKKVFEGAIFDVYQWQQKMYDGSYATFERLRRDDTVVIIGSVDDKIIMIDQEQPGKKLSMGSPAGRIAKGEEPLEAAKREFIEETGYSSNDWELWCAYQPHSKIDWFVYVFLARDCKKTAEQNLDNGEKITLKYVDFDEFIDWSTSAENKAAEFGLRIARLKLSGKLNEFKDLIHM